MRRALLLLLAGCHATQPDKTLHGDALKNPESCKPCHASHYDEWSGSMHAYASDDPVFLAMNARGQRETKGALGGFCVKCHAPQAFADGLSKDGLNLDKVPAASKGVTCFFCHSVESVNGVHDNPLALAGDEVLRGGIADPLDNPAHAASYSPLLDHGRIESAATCGACHDIVNANGVALERTFGEWKASQWGNGTVPGFTCGTCHMSPRKQPAADFPGVSLRTVHSHQWPAVDTALTAFPHAADQKSAIEALLLKDTLVGQLCVDPPLADQSLTVRLETFAGHDFPSGASQDRRLWLEIVGYQADKVLFQSGVVPAGKSPADVGDPQLLLFRDVIFDSGGKEAHMFWDAHGSKSKLLTPLPDPPPPAQGHTYSQTYKFPTKDGLADRITMKVYLQPLGLDVLQSLVDSGDLDKKYLALVPTFQALPPIEWHDKDGFACFPKDVLKPPM